jgi:N6-L-threonylcarbamoyladenine synthase
VVESLLEKLRRALDAWPVPEVVVCGGVAANTLLRRRAAEALEGRARLTIPPLALCTDNAAMIAAAAAHTPRAAELRADPSLGW